MNNLTASELIEILREYPSTAQVMVGFVLDHDAKAGEKLNCAVTRDGVFTTDFFKRRSNRAVEYYKSLPQKFQRER